MVVSPKYKHFDGISYVGETRVRVNDMEDANNKTQMICVLGCGRRHVQFHCLLPLSVPVTRNALEVQAQGRHSCVAF